MSTVLNVRNFARKRNGENRKLGRPASIDESIDVTLSLSPSLKREQVSWSSSDGSTYYSDDDEVELRKRRHMRPVHRKKENDKQKKPFLSSTTCTRKSNNPKISSVISNKPKASSSKLHNPNVSNQVANKDFEKKREESRNTKQCQKRITTKKRNSLLENIDRFPGIDIATSNEELSAVGFLTTEDTAKVFCTSSIPFEVATGDKFSFEISAISTSSSDDSSIIASCSRSDVAVRHYQENNSNNEDAIQRQFSDTSSRKKSTPMISEHSVDVISITYQEPVSSLEYESTWDDLSLTSAISTDGKERMKHPTSPKTKELSLSMKPLASPQIDSKLSKIKEMEKGKSETEEKIKQLKAKIKSMQVSNDSSDSATNQPEDDSSTQVEAFVSCQSPSPRRIENKVEAFVSCQSPSQRRIENQVEAIVSCQSPSQRRIENEMIDPEGAQNIDISTPLMRRYHSGEAKQRKNITPKKGKDQRSPNHHQHQEIDQAILDNRIPLMIPVLEREEISVIEFDASPADDTVIDVEAGKFARDKWVRCERAPNLSKTEKVKRVKVQPKIGRTKILLTQGKAKVVAAYDYISPIIIRKKMEFQEKPRNEQIIMLAIGALSFIFVILLLIMMGQ